MAPVYDFRHVEIDKIGRGKRVTRPPGGECSDIFGVDQTDGQALCKTNGSSPVQQNGGRRNSDTQNRLFGPPDVTATPRRSVGVNRMKSNIFSGDNPSPGSPAPRTPSAKKSIGPVRRNPITGELTPESPVNGCNGHSTPVSPETPVANGERHRPPPGGRSSGIF